MSAKADGHPVWE